MKNKELIKDRFSILKGNPTREERIKALYTGKIIKVTDPSTTYHKLDRYCRLTFSTTCHPSSFHPYHHGYDYSKVLDDYNETTNSIREIEIL